VDATIISTRRPGERRDHRCHSGTRKESAIKRSIACRLKNPSHART
jgi:hypothetical protein